MARRAVNNGEEVYTIAPDGGAIDRGGGRNGNGGNGHRNGNGRNHAEENAEPASPEQGTLTVEGNNVRLEGNRDTIEVDKYFLQKTLPALRGFVGELVNRDPENFTGVEEARYSQVITELANMVTAEAKAPVNKGCEAYLKDVGGLDMAERIEKSFNAQLAKSFILINTYASEVGTGVPSAQRLNQEKALLVYAELMLERMEGRVEIDDYHLVQTMETLGFSDREIFELGIAFMEVNHHVEPTLTSFADEIISVDGNFIPADERAQMIASLSLIDGAEEDPPAAVLNPVAVNQYLENKNNVTEVSYRALIDALDRLNEPARARWIEQRDQNSEINLNEHPFSTWESQIAERNQVALQPGEHLPSKFYINGCLGSGNIETKIFGIQGRHKLKHTIKTETEKAPVRTDGQRREKLVNVEAVTIGIMAAVYQGELNERHTLQPGESRPKEFFERVVDLQVWGVHLNSADKVANFMDQLAEAEALAMNGPEVTRVLGKYLGNNSQEVQNANFFRIPVVNHRGEADFLVIDRATLTEMMRVAHASRDSYARLAQMDPRYAVHSREERHAAFRAQLRQHVNTPESWIDQERDYVVVETVSREKIMALRGTGDADDYRTSLLLERALQDYTARFNDFQLNYCRLSQYRNIAISRLTGRNIQRNAPDFNQLLRGEMNVVALEYMNRWNAFRNVTSRLLNMRNVEALEQELAGFLASINNELEV